MANFHSPAKVFKSRLLAEGAALTAWDRLVTGDVGNTRKIKGVVTVEDHSYGNASQIANLKSENGTMTLCGAAKIQTKNFLVVFLPSLIFGLMPVCPIECASKFLLVYGVLLHATHRCVYVWVLMKYIRGYPDMDFPLIALLSINCLFKACCPIVHIFSMFRERHKFISLVERCYEEDFTKNRFTLFTLIGIFLWPIPLFARQIVDLRWVHLLYTLGGVFDVTCVFIIAMQYCTMIEIAAKRLIAVKVSLLMKLYTLDTAIDVHHDILKFTASIHSIYERTILIEICYLGFDFIVAFYDAVQSVRLHQLYLWGACTLSYSIGCIFTVYIVCNACERVQQKAEKFNAELFRLMRENKELCKNEKLQLYVTMKQTVNFTACGFFTLGYPLVTSIIAAATTYLVILVQFSMPPPATKS